MREDLREVVKDENGLTYEIYFFDSKGELVEKERAVKYIVKVINEQGELLYEMFSSAKDPTTIDVVTKEQYDYLKDVYAQNNYDMKDLDKVRIR